MRGYYSRYGQQRSYYSTNPVLDFAHGRISQRTRKQSRVHPDHTVLDHVKLEYALRLGFKASNNEAEYEALVTELKMAKSMKA